MIFQTASDVDGKRGDRELRKVSASCVRGNQGVNTKQCSPPTLVRCDTREPSCCASEYKLCPACETKR